MRLETAQTEVHSSGTAKTKGLSILASSKTFNVLSNLLYKHKVRAVIREVSCNAVDGHNAYAREHGEARPTFDVHLPTTFEPEFWVRDYGTGLPEELMFDLYTVYFASTKANSNDDIGGFGLGCKSPLCVSDMFTVISWHKGIQSTYSIYMKDGEPQMTKMSSMKSDEPSGVKVVVPADDVYQWHREAQYVYRTFEGYRPNFIGYELTVGYVPFNGRLAELSWQGNLAHAVMGGVSYPIPDEYFDDTIFGAIFRNYKNFNRKTIFIKFEIGDLAMQPSREELSLDPLTIEKLKEVIREVDEDYRKNIQSIIESCDTFREVYAKIDRNYPFVVWDTLIDGMTFQGKPIRKWKSTVMDMNLDYPLQVARVNTSRIERHRFNRMGDYTRGIGTPQDLIRLGHDFTVTIINDVKNGSQLIRGLYSLGRIPKTVVLVDSLNNEFEDDGDKLTAGQGQMQSARRYMSKFHAKEKAGRVIVLSKIKDSLMADMINNGLVAKKKRSGKPNPVIVYDPTGSIYKKYETSMYKEDIEELDDGYFVIYHDSSTRCDATLVQSTKILSSGKQSKATEVKLLPGYFNSQAVEAFAKLSGKKVYVFRMAHAKMAIANQNLKPITDDFTDMAEQSILRLKNITRSINIPSWLHILTYNPLTKWIYDKFIPEPSYDEILIDEFFHHTSVCLYMNARIVKAVDLYINKREDAAIKLKSELISFRRTNVLVYAYCENVKYSSNIPNDAAVNINELVKL